MTALVLPSAPSMEKVPPVLVTALRNCSAASGRSAVAGAAMPWTTTFFSRAYAAASGTLKIPLPIGSLSEASTIARLRSSSLRSKRCTHEASPSPIWDWMSQSSTVPAVKTAYSSL